MQTGKAFLHPRTPVGCSGAAINSRFAGSLPPVLRRNDRGNREADKQLAAGTMNLPATAMRDHLATLIDDFRRYGDEIAVVRYQGNRRRASTYAELARLAGRFAALLERRGIGEGDRVLLWAEN